MSEPQYRTIAKFDKMSGQLDKLPDVTKTSPSTIKTCHPLIGEVQTFIIQTYRQREIGDTIFLEYIDAETSYRIVIPPDVANAIVRQRDALSTKVRKKVGKQQAALRKARGELPGFMRGKKKPKGE